MLISRILTSFALVASLATAETDYRFAFPQSEMLMGIDVKWLMKSPLGQSMRKELSGSLGELKAFEGFMDQIDSVHLSVVSKGPKSSDLLVLVEGRFELDKLKALGALQGLKPQQWGKVMVLVPPAAKSRPTPGKKASFTPAQFKMDPSNTRPAFALLDAKRVVIGEEAPLRVALERIETGLTPQANPLFDRARDLEAANDVWLVGNTNALNLNGATAPKSNDPMSQLATQVRGIALGLAVRRNVSLDLQLQTTTPKAATQILDLAKGGIALAKMQPTSGEPFPVDIDKVLNMSAAGNVVKLNISMEQADIDRIMASKLNPLNSGKPPVVSSATPAPAAAPAVAEQPAAPAAPVRKTVMIYGLPGGPKEVPVQ